MRWPWQTKESELERELRYHIESLADAYERDGMPREEALRQARREFGGLEQVKEECRDESRWNWLWQAAQDIRFGLRMMRKTPSISIAAVATLALGIGATTAILGLADTLIWRALPVPEPSQLTEILWTSRKNPDGLLRGGSGSTFPEDGMRVSDFFGRQAYETMRKSVAGKAEVAGHVFGTPVSASFGGTVAVAQLRGVTGNFFGMLQLQPFAGRLLSDADDRADAAPAVVLTHRFWTRQLSSARDVVGQTMLINNRAYAIAGILPPAFTGIEPGDNTQFYVPIAQCPQVLDADGWYRKAMNDPRTWWMQLMARRAPGVSQETLRAGLEPAYTSTWAQAPKSDDMTPRLRLSEADRGLGRMRRKLASPMWALLGLVGTVLLIACANIANLLLARAVEREKEAALRLSLGCGTGRLMRQFLTESLLLAVAGGLLSLAVAALLGQAMSSLIPSESRGMTIDTDLNWRMLAGTGIVTLFTAFLFGLYPAWRTARVDASPALKEGSGSAGTISRFRWRPAKALLLLLQVALGVLLVTSAIVFAERLNQMTGRETGFERNHVLLFDVRPGELNYRTERLRQFYVELEDRLGALPGVARVGLSMTRPMMGGGYWDDVGLPGQPRPAPSAIHHGSPAFLEALGVPILAGRAMTLEETRRGAKVAVLSEDLAKALGGGVGVGRWVVVSGKEYEVIGIARQARYSEMERTPTVAYLPFDYQRPAATVVVRTAVSPMAVLPAVRQAVKEVNRDLPMVDVYTMEQQISRTLQRERLFAWLCGAFGVLALVLCAVGLYGLMAHTTARRTAEIGIRMALGASGGNVMAQVLIEGLRLVAVGLLLGTPLALYAVRIASEQKLLPEGPLPVWTVALAVGVLAVSAVAAILGPAVRASSVEPMQALRRG